MGSFATPWSELVDRDRPLPEYPRPSLVRDEWLCLNGAWDCALARRGEAKRRFDRTILVPFPIESALSGLGEPLLPGEVLAYRRCFELPPGWAGRRIFLRFGAVDWEARVSVNGSSVGSHRGGYVPFSFDITEFVHADGRTEELIVEVRDPTDRGAQCRGKQSLRPRGILYTACSGIWGTVWLEPAPATRIERIVARIEPGTKAREGKLLVSALISAPPSSPAPAAHRLRVVASAEGRAVAEAEGLFESGAAAIALRIPEPIPWSPDTPFLYRLSLELDGVDRAASYAALRGVSLGKDEAGRTRILLNDEPLYNNAVLDQGYWPEGVYTAPVDEALASDIRLAKALGFNAIRKHAKVESERWYWHCDRLGILVWQDIPSGGSPMSILHSALLGFAGLRLRDDRRLGRFGRKAPEWRAAFEREAAEIVDFLEGFACIAAWVPFNEGWGQFESARIARELAARDPSRLVDAASGWYDNGAGHFASRHDYSRRPRLPAWLAGRAAALTEFGGLTLRIAGHSTDDRRQFGYAGAADGEDLASRYEALARRVAGLAEEGLAASVYTQLTDVEIERNGLATYDRRVVKAEASRIRAANLGLIASGSNPAPPGPPPRASPY